jgi:hypothetical protein
MEKKAARWAYLHSMKKMKEFLEKPVDLANYDLEAYIKELVALEEDQHNAMVWLVNLEGHHTISKEVYEKSKEDNKQCELMLGKSGFLRMSQEHNELARKYLNLQEEDLPFLKVFLKHIVEHVECLKKVIRLEGGHKSVSEEKWKMMIKWFDDITKEKEELEKNLSESKTVQCPKTTTSSLEEWCVRSKVQPLFSFLEPEGPPHNRSFTCKVKVKELEASGKGKTKKAAKHEASKMMMNLLKIE